MWKSEPYSRSRDTAQGLRTSASPLFVDVDQLQPLDHIRSGVETSGNHRSSMGSRHEYEHGKLPLISTFVKLKGNKRGRDWTRSETVLSDSQQGGGVVKDLLQETEEQTFQQPFPGREQQSQDPILPTQTSDKPGSRGDPVSRSNIQQTQEDQFLVKFWKNKSGHIKRPMNAFMLWSNIHRCAVKKQNPGATSIDISTHLGNEWSKLSEEDRNPYFEMAKKLKQVHEKIFPDYEYRPLKKKKKPSHPPRQKGGQGPTVSASQPVPQGLCVNAQPAMMPYTVGYQFYPSFYQYIPMNPYSSGNIQSDRVFKSSPNIYNPMKTAENYHNSHPQMVSSPYYNITQQQEHSMGCNPYEYMTGSNSTPDSLTPTDISTNPQLSTNYAVDCKCDDYVDVVGLF